MRFISFRPALIASATTMLAMPTLSAQDTPPAKQRAQAASLIWTRAADRAVLGVTLAASSRADTTGVRIEEVDANGPAAKAGLKDGDVITEINGVSLRVSTADAEDLALAGLAQRRLQRTLAKAKPGDEVDLRVRSGTAARAVKVKTISAAELDGTRVQATTRVRTDDNDQRSAIGVSVGTVVSRRDTLGLFVTSVVGDGPAEKAGLIEGERIAAVNGVDVRIPKEDVEDASSASARVNRFVREVQKVAPGGTVTLRVYGNGRYRDVAVKTVKMSELPSSGMSVFVGDGGVRVFRGTSPMAMPMIERMPPAGTTVRAAPGAAPHERPGDRHPRRGIPEGDGATAGADAGTRAEHALRGEGNCGWGNGGFNCGLTAGLRGRVNRSTAGEG